MSVFSENLKAYRLRRGMTQASLAAEINVSQNAIYNWENGKREPSLETINKLAEVLKIDTIDFFMYNDTFMTGFDLTSLNIDEINAVLRSHPKISKSIQSEDAELSGINDKSVVIDTEIDTTHPFYLLQEKIRNGEQLTNEETSLLTSYIKEGVISTTTSIKQIGKEYEKYYQLLNNEGQKKAIEHIEMLTKIPEYQKDTINNNSQ